MKQFFLLISLVSLLSISVLAQSPTPVTSPTASPANTQAVFSPSVTPTPAVVNADRPSLPFWVEMFASAVMLTSVVGVFWLVLRHQADKGQTINPRHIQFVSVCLIVPTILILGLEKCLLQKPVQL